MVPPATRTTPEISVIVRLSADGHAAGEARRAVLDLCHRTLDPAMCDDAVLLTSELVTNASRVSSGAITVTMTLGASGVRIAVTDDDPYGTPVTATGMALTVPALAESGRGLLLLEHVAGAWGTDHIPGGKTVWFRLP
jgi:anti-sigma regulatory factor (Ser/Thr protein kinase)